jgi:putative ABC transport system substrate-binding protein
MDRREFITGVACGVLSTAAAQAAPSTDRPRRVGWLQWGFPNPPEEQQLQIDALAEVGWIAGKNVLIDRRYGSYQDLLSAAGEFVKKEVDLIVTDGTSATLAAKAATSRIPILIWIAGDPVAAGLVESMARPGGNVTGISSLLPQLRVKRLSLLRELMPGLRRVAELDASTNPYVRFTRKHLDDAYKSLGLEPVYVDAAKFTRYEDVIAEFVRRRAQAVNTVEDALLVEWLPNIFDALLRASLPTVVGASDRDLLEAGALLAYDNDYGELKRRAAVLFDKLLRGAKPADLPIEQATKFSLGINLRTARALGITVPHSLLLTTDRLIQ